MEMYSVANKIYNCGTCGNLLGRTEIAISNGRVYMCSICWNNAINSEKTTEKDEEVGEKKKEIEEEKKMSPQEIVKYLDMNIIGQESAKKTLAVAIYNHYKRINAKENSVKIPKSNILIKGPTGSGKTYIIKNLAKILNVPFYIADASIITEAGYKGNDVEGVLTGLYQASGCDIEKAEKGIVYLDEFDKLSVNYGYSNDKNKSVGAGVQRQILKILEGCVIDIPETGNIKTGEIISINTENILFICGGAFVEIDEKKPKDRPIGFFPIEDLDTVSVEVADKKLTTDDFINYGLLPEVVGRLPIIVSLDKLSEMDICSILTDSGESITKSYRKLFEEYGVKLIIEQGAIEEIAHQAYIRGVGARGINAIVEGIMQDLLYEIPSDSTITKCIITKEAVLGIDMPFIIRESIDALKEQQNAS